MDHLSVGVLPPRSDTPMFTNNPQTDTAPRSSPDALESSQTSLPPIHPLSAIPETLRSHQPSPVPGLHSRAPSRLAKHPKARTSRPATPSMAPGVDPNMGPTEGLGTGDDGKQLEVSDALTYLDDVKRQFSDKPDVYNHFLDIMKEFKSQAIDTPGVIERVSFLFKGYPALIQGFNTFLPPGYRIDCSSDLNVIQVTTPSGTGPLGLSINRGAGGGLDAFGFNIAGPHTPNPSQAAGSNANFSSQRVGTPLSQSRPPSRQPQPHAPQPFRPAPFSPGLHGTTNAASFLGNLNNPTGRMVEKADLGGGAPPADYNHAMEFIGKIKNRYQNDGDTYKRFLEVLQTYQRERRHWKESHVYQEVQQLFKDAPDLLVEFKSFLPEIGAAMDTGPDFAVAEFSRKEPVSRKKVEPGALNKRRKKPVDKEPAHGKPGTSSRAKKPKHGHKAEPQSPSFAPGYLPASSPPLSQQAAPHHSQHQQSHTQLYQAPPEPGSHAAQNEKSLIFFERIKKSLDPFAHDELLRLLNLYTSDVIDTRWLIERAGEFLGGGASELMLQFKDIMLWDDRMKQGPQGSLRTSAPEYAAPVVVEGKPAGPSYRRLPESEMKIACSGRDALAHSLLNDEWLSHPSWAGEDSSANVTFMVLKKNPHEDVLYRCEDERHDYHTHLNWMQSTIAVLEPILLRIHNLSAEERAAFRLPPDFGGPSKSIYHRLLKHVYGHAFHEVLLALQETPAVAVPVVLLRLKTKHDEWRRSHRELNKAWREIDIKNFYKGLDHMSSTFKQNDKRNITAKQLVLEIEAAKMGAPKTGSDKRKMKGKAKLVEPLPAAGTWHLEFAMPDIAVLQDALKLVYTYLDRAGSAQYTARERRAIEKFLRSFVPVLCMMPVAEFDAACGLIEGPNGVAASGELSDVEDHGDGEGEGGDAFRKRSANGTFASPSTGSVGGLQADDLRKRLLKTHSGEASPSGSAPASPTMSPVPSTSKLPIRLEADAAERWNTGWSVEDGVGEDDTWIREACGDIADDEPSDASAAPPHRPFWGNTTFYTLLRLIQILYTRLSLCKELGAELAAKRGRPLASNPIAVELGMFDPTGPAYVYETAETLVKSDPSISSDEEKATVNPPYLYMLDSVEKTFDLEMDPLLFEEHMRYLFGAKAFNVFTLDKVCAALIKQVQQVVQDHKCQELWRLLRKERHHHDTRSPGASGHDKIRYRRAAEQHVGTDDHLYRIEWDSDAKALRMRLVGPLDPSIDEARNSRGRWREYVDTYISRYPTEWLPTPLPAAATASGGGVRAPVFLRRNLQVNDAKRAEAAARKADPSGRPPDIAIVGDCRTAARISLGTYRLFYEAESEDFLVVQRPRDDYEALSARAVARKEEACRCRLLQ